MTCPFCFQSLTSAALSFLSAMDDFPSHENQPDDPTKVGCSAFSLWKTHSVETSLSESTQKPHPSRDFSLLYVRVPNQLFCFRIRQDKHRFHPFSRKSKTHRKRSPFCLHCRTKQTVPVFCYGRLWLIFTCSNDVGSFSATH